ncbi:MAG: hypothetical protein AAF578_00270 [Pseudomonadota bacterium]
MTAKIQSIEGGKKEMCPHCGLFPADEHPDDSCPRIAAVSYDQGAVAYTYVDLHVWERWLEGHDRSIPGIK